VAYTRDREMKFTVNMTLIVDEEENILPVNYDSKEGDEQSLKDILTDYFFDIDGITLEGVKIKKHE
tara:strand:- start:370 stop:567 length:198 start_codon:yes stop_codon:yes gene_type:complete